MRVPGYVPVAEACPAVPSLPVGDEKDVASDRA
jgi:hypothetical protein